MNDSLKVDKVVDGLITNNRHVSTAHNPTYHSQFRFVSVEHKIIQESHRRNQNRIMYYYENAMADPDEVSGFQIESFLLVTENEIKVF